MRCCRAGSEREWFRQRLLPLLGIEATSPAEREELFTAWRRFFEHVAELDPMVLVFEDLHWADPALLAFLEHLADRAEGVPLLIVGTARPELFHHHPDYANGLRNIHFDQPGSVDGDRNDQPGCAGCWTPRVVPVELQTPILDRAGGNPLYAEEFIRLIKDKSCSFRQASAWVLTEDAEIPFPDSVQALIAARLDTLPVERKALLADAAVVGKVFWAGAVAAMGNLAEVDVVDILHELSRRAVRPSRRSTMEGEAEYASGTCWPVTSPTARSRAPPAQPATSPPLTWIESKTPDRLEDLADVLAYHYTAALDLATAAGQTDLTDLQDSALRFLILAGERALGLNTAAALDAFERALALTPTGHPVRPTPSPTSGMPHETAAASPTLPPPSTKPFASTANAATSSPPPTP